MKVTVLGSGTSTGVPQIGCTCEVCTSKDKHDHRLRCSALVETNNSRILIDCGPDFRQQMLLVNDFKPLDAVLISHEHYDHVGGLDDLRPFCAFNDIPVFAEDITAEHLKKRIPYCFAENLYPGVPKLELRTISTDVHFYVSNAEGITTEIIPIRVMHGRLPIVGYRIEKMAWITDMLSMSDKEYEKLKDLDCLFINSLRLQPHPSHQNLTEAVEAALKIGAKQTYFIHISHQMGLHAKIDKKLPQNINLAYDGLVVNL